MVEMSTKVMCNLREDKQEIQKQLGCMNGIFQLFDRRYLLGNRRHGHNQKMLSQGQADNGKEEFNNASDKLKEKHGLSTESSRNSFSSSCSSLDCSKRVQTETSSFCRSIISEPSSPTSYKKQDLSADIRAVVKDSMTRKPRVVSVKTVTTNKRNGPNMTRVDSPRPLQNPKPVTYERKEQNLAKLREITGSISKDVTVTSRLSYDGRESQYKLKSISNILKERPRLSLDSKQSFMKNRTNSVDQSQTNDPGGSKRPQSSVVARLMGLDILKNEPVNRIDESISRLSKKSVSSKIPLEPAPWKQEVKQPVNKKASKTADHGCKSVYGQIEKRLTEVEFKTSGKDLRALKHILEAIQRTAIKPANQVMTNLEKVNHADGRKYTAGRRSATNNGGKKTLIGEKYCNSIKSGPVSPRLQKSKNGIEKDSVNGIRKQSNGRINVSKSKIGSVNRVKTDDQSCRDSCQIGNLSQEGDTVSFPSESEGSQNEAMAEQPSPVSVLDAFYTEDTTSPVQKKTYDFKDDEDICFNEREWSQFRIDNLASTTELDQSTFRFNHVKLKNTNQSVHHQIELLDEATINPHEAVNGDDNYIKEIISASGFLKNINYAITTTITHLHPTDSLINPNLFNILEKTKERTSKSEKTRRKLIFDTVNHILINKLARSSSSGLSGEKLLEDLCLEIKNLQINRSGDLFDEILNKDWDDKCSEISSLVLDIERLIFRDLISEIVNACLQDGPGRHCRQLFLM